MIKLMDEYFNAGFFSRMWEQSARVASVVEFTERLSNYKLLLLTVKSTQKNPLAYINHFHLPPELFQMKLHNHFGPQILGLKCTRLPKIHFLQH
jgi:hypothetical protein